MAETVLAGTPGIVPPYRRVLESGIGAIVVLREFPHPVLFGIHDPTHCESQGRTEGEVGAIGSPNPTGGVQALSNCRVLVRSNQLEVFGSREYRP